MKVTGEYHQILDQLKVKGVGVSENRYHRSLWIK